jgi:hypothetical protein
MSRIINTSVTGSTTSLTKETISDPARFIFLAIGSIAAGFAFSWIAGFAAFFLTLAIIPN